MAAFRVCDTCLGKDGKTEAAIVRISTKVKTSNVVVETIESTDACLNHLRDQVDYHYTTHGDDDHFLRVDMEKLA